MISPAVIWGQRDEAVKAILARAQLIEGRRSERCLKEADVAVFVAAVQRHPAAKVRVYANRGAFVANKYRFSAPITILEYTPPDEHGPAQVAVSEGDAKRRGAKGPWLTVDGKKEL